MLCRSTGLGKTELQCVLIKIEGRKKNVLLMHMQSTAPITTWHIRVIMGPQDLWKALTQLLKPSCLWAAAKIMFVGKMPNPQDDDW